MLQTLIISDIFGKTSALGTLASAIDKQAQILDPYAGKFMDFADEKQAYQQFSENVGVQQYAQKLLELVGKADKQYRIVAFSVGASALWQASTVLTQEQVSDAVGYYGSQIRYQPNLTPNFPVELVFPAMEKHFSVQDLMQQLARRENVSLRQSEYLHGFMNRCSDNFSESGSLAELRFLTSL